MSLSVIKAFRSSIFKKIWVALSGMFLCIFLLGHLAGNSMMIINPEMFNRYAHTLISNPFIYFAEAVIVFFFFLHIFWAIKTNVENWRARPISYHKRATKWDLQSLASATMPYTGALLLVFIVKHIIDFKYGPYYTISYEGVQMRNLYQLLLEYFGNIHNVIAYVIAMTLLSIHVLHGVWSAFQSIGINRSTLNTTFRRFSYLFSVIIVISYITFPVWCYIQGVK
ncbi:MAG: succinate dehydrogenase cytochrome b subunit [Bacteriovoracaceae bacterium]|nr:succinate dehydrogenase cytochrome b subunit [Bacteriovoracaceae bacterium]